MKIVFILLVAGSLRHASISKVEIPARYNQYRHLFKSERSWERWCESDMQEMQELDKMWAEEHGEEE